MCGFRNWNNNWWLCCLPCRYQLTNVESLVLDIVCWRCNIMQSVLVVHVGLNQAHPSPISEARRPCLSWHILFYIVGSHYIPIMESIDSICRDSMGEIYDIWMALNALSKIVCIITCYLVQVYCNLYWYECPACHHQGGRLLLFCVFNLLSHLWINWW